MNRHLKHVAPIAVLSVGLVTTCVEDSGHHTEAPEAPFVGTLEADQAVLDALDLVREACFDSLVPADPEDMEAGACMNFYCSTNSFSSFGRKDQYNLGCLVTGTTARAYHHGEYTDVQLDFDGDVYLDEEVVTDLTEEIREKRAALLEDLLALDISFDDYNECGFAPEERVRQILDVPTVIEHFEVDPFEVRL